MAATDPDTSPQTAATRDWGPALSSTALDERLAEEIGRAERHGTGLSCLLVVLDDPEQMAREHGAELPGQALAYLARALRRELRRFDRIGRPSDRELLIVLPGADDSRGEMVARRVLERVGTIKVEVDGARRPVDVAVGLAAWRAPMDAEDLLARARAAARRAGPAPAGDPAGATADTAPATAPPGEQRPPWLRRAARS
jgi:diguanylate cyclase (GGDEF)-like protein